VRRKCGKEAERNNCGKLCAVMPRSMGGRGGVGGGARQEKNTAVFSNEWQPHVRRIVCKVRTIEKQLNRKVVSTSKNA